MEVTHFEAELTYPTTAQVLGEYLDSCCDCPAGHIVVRGEGDPLEDAQSTPVPDTYEVKLTQEDMGGESGARPSNASTPASAANETCEE